MQRHGAIYFQILTLLVLSIISPNLIAYDKAGHNQTLSIATPSWKNFTEENGEGFYFELLRLIYDPLNIAVSYQIIPWARCELLVLNKQRDALIGSYKERTEEHHYPRNPVWLDISAAAFKLERVSWNGTETLNNKKVGWIRGYRYDMYIDASMDIQRLNDNNQGWGMLALDRLDFYIDSLTDLNLFMSTNDIDESIYATEPVLVNKMFIRFAKTERGKQFSEIYDERILALQKDGQLKALFEKWGYGEHYSRFVEALTD